MSTCRNLSLNSVTPPPYRHGHVQGMWQTAGMQIHLVRHGEVENPGHVVYADLPGFTLSRLGRDQAHTAGRRLANASVGRIVTSPLDRAVITAQLLSHEINAPTTMDNRLTEWRLASRWAGVGWDDLQDAFPGELEAYLENPYELPFAPESLRDASERVARCVNDWAERESADIAFVSHQDPLHGARLALTGSTVDRFHRDKPAHCSIVTLRGTGNSWSMLDYWAPEA